MKCPNGPHVHKTLECPACSTEADYVMVKPEEAVDCLTCGFELHVPEDFVKYARELFEAAERARKASLSPNPHDQVDAVAYWASFRSNGDRYAENQVINFPLQGLVSKGDQIRLNMTPFGFEIIIKSPKNSVSLDWIDGLS